MVVKVSFNFNFAFEPTLGIYCCCYLILGMRGKSIGCVKKKSQLSVIGLLQRIWISYGKNLRKMSMGRTQKIVILRVLNAVYVEKWMKITITIDV